MGNYNLKNIVLGIGIGLVISSMINISISNRELTVEEIKKEAAKHNLIILTKEEILNNQAPPVIPETPAPTPTLAPAGSETSTPTPTPTPTVAPTKAPVGSTAASGGKVTVTVKGGMSSESIAGLLRDAGLIKDTKAFLKRLGEVDKDDKLKIGTFDIPKGSGYDDIIRILTK
jgi:hypothetical protein